MKVGIAVVILILLAFFICMFVITYSAKQKRKKSINKVKDQFNAIDVCSMNHVYGLGIPESAPCSVCICEDKFVFVRNRTDINLSFDKVTDVTIKTNRDIQTQYTSSAGGAVGGALLFGPLGAVIGGRTKKKVDISTTNYLIFTYVKNNETMPICFLANNLSFAQKCVKAFNESAASQKVKSIDL